METIDIRPILDDRELEEALDLWAEVFPKDRAFFEERIRLDPECGGRETTWVARVNDRLAAAVQIFPFFIHYKGMELKCGGIGNVAALPEFRGRQLVRTILRQQTKWMRRNGFDLSLLFTHIPDFYEKEGWYSLRGTSLVIEADRLPDYSHDGHCKVQLFKAADLTEVKHIYDLFNEERCGARVRTEAYWRGNLGLKRSGEFLTAFKDGRLVAYLRWELFDAERMDVVECCYLPGYQDAVCGFVNWFRSRPASGRKEIRLQVPDDHFLWRLFKRCGAREEPNHGVMWKILEPHSFYKKILLILDQRMKQKAVNEQSMLVRSDNEDVLFRFENNRFAIETLKNDAVAVDEILLRKPEELVEDLLSGTSLNHRFYAALFPKTSYAFWKSDRF